MIGFAKSDTDKAFLDIFQQFSCTLAILRGVQKLKRDHRFVFSSQREKKKFYTLYENFLRRPYNDEMHKLSRFSTKFFSFFPL